MWYTVYQYPQITILIVEWWSTRSSFQKWLICYLLSALIFFTTGLKKIGCAQLGGIQNWVSFSANDRQALLSIARRETRSRRCMEHLVWVQTARKAQSTWKTFQRILHAPFLLPNPYMSDISLRTLLNAVLDCQLLRRIWRLVGYGKWFAVQRNQCIRFGILYCIVSAVVRCGILWYVFEAMQWKRKQTLKCTCNF